MPKITDTLKERGDAYGDYQGGINLRSTMMEAIQSRHMKAHGVKMPRPQLLKIYDIICKISRLAVTPDHVDTWHDIQGYARLAEESYAATPSDLEVLWLCGSCLAAVPCPREEGSKRCLEFRAKNPSVAFERQQGKSAIKAAFAEGLVCEGSCGHYRFAADPAPNFCSKGLNLTPGTCDQYAEAK